MSAPFDYFIALDGHGLNGFEGYAGVARMRHEAGRFDVRVKFFDGLAGGHATQINPSGTLGFLGNLSQTLCFYDPETLEEVTRASTLRFAAPDTFYSSQTHVVWLDDRHFMTAIGDDFVRFDVRALDRPEVLGPHRVTLPHAMKKSASGRYVFYGAMDHDARGHANEVGVFDLERGEARVVKLPATAWHLGVHPSRDVFYAPTQRCVAQDGGFAEYLPAHYKDYLFEIDGERAEVTRHLTIPKDAPGGGLTSDVVVTEDRVLYNSPFGGVVTMVDLETFRRVETLDERPGLFDTLTHLPAGLGNLVESLARTNLPDHTHSFVKAFRMSRGSLLDGSYGLTLSPDRAMLLSAHRGLNEVRVYDYPSLRLTKRVPFPSIRESFPAHIGRLDDPRLGFHHSTLVSR
ncbi:MAG: hypothetical protein RLP09_28875 [Sandaracinaceae bacterium]